MKKNGIKLVRAIRTAYSEQYFVWRDGENLAQLDIHYHNEIHATLILLSKNLPIEEVAYILKKIEELLIKEDPNSKNFVVTVYKGEDIGDKISEYIKSKA